MESNYFIVFKDISILLFRLNYDHKNEEPAVIDFEMKTSKAKDLYFEDVIQDLYSKFKGRYDHVSKPIELLKILLANGYSLKLQRRNYEFHLYKDYFPVSYLACSTSQIIQLGNYYRSSTANADEQFVRFSAWIDNLSGFKGMNQNMILQFINAGFSIVARESEKETALVLVKGEGSIVDGANHTLRYLLD